MLKTAPSALVPKPALSRAQIMAMWAKKKSDLLATLPPRSPTPVSDSELSVEAILRLKGESIDDSPVSRSSDAASKRSRSPEFFPPDSPQSATDTEEEEPPAKVVRLAPAESKAPPAAETIPSSFELKNFVIKNVKLPSRTRVVKFIHASYANEFHIQRGAIIAYFLDKSDSAALGGKGRIGVAVVEMAFPAESGTLLIRMYKPNASSTTWSRTPYCRLLGSASVVCVMRPHSIADYANFHGCSTNCTFCVFPTPSDEATCLSAYPVVDIDTTISIRPNYSSYELWYGRVLASFTNPKGLKCYVLRWFDEIEGHPGSYKLTDQVGDASVSLFMRKFPAMLGSFSPDDFNK